MSLDLSKLTPAPWSLVDEGDGRHVIVDKNGKYVPGLLFYGHVGIAVAHRIIAEHNAFDVMMRRGWGVTRLPNTRWVLIGNDCWLYVGEKNWIRDTLIEAYAALVEADKWYKEHVDNKESK